MTYAIAAAGTGGHVFPGLAVGEALVSLGVPRAEVHFVGGDRLEATVYPEAGFSFHRFEVQGLSRSLSPRNLVLPIVVIRAVDGMTRLLRRLQVRSVLGLGGYVTIPAALAARRVGCRLLVAEQNAAAGLANRIAGRLAERRFGAFPVTTGLPGADWVGNPVRREIAEFDRAALRGDALERYALSDDHPVIGVFGGSLGAKAVNDAVDAMVESWEGPPVQLLHLVGSRNLEPGSKPSSERVMAWRRIGFETEMRWFYAACDLVVCRAGGGIAELGVTATPSVLVPGRFGSGGHQAANAAPFVDRGAAVVVEEDDLSGLGAVVRSLLTDRSRLESMAAAARTLARPDAGKVIARAMMAP